MRSTDLQSDSIGLSSANMVMRTFYPADNRAGEWGILMQIKPGSWDFAGDFCCWEFQRRAQRDEYGTYPTISTDGVKVFFGGATITNCPFCGKKIELEKVQI